MRYFEVLGGNHVQDEKTYKKGDVVETNMDLVTMFPRKFNEIVGPGKKAQKEVKGKTLNDELKEQGIDDLTGLPKEDADVDIDIDVCDIKSALGKNVTELYPLATENNLVVLRKNSWFHVADADNPDVALNAKGMKKVAVKEFVEEIIEEDQGGE